MTRALLLWGGLLAACAEGTPATPAATGPAATKAPAEVKVPTTGTPRIQDSHDAIKREIRMLEKRKAEGKSINPTNVKSQIELVDQLILASKMAIDAEALKQHQTRVGKMRQQLKLFRKQDAELANEIREIRKMIAGAKQGVDQLPAGYTETELLDRAGDLEVKLQKIQKAEKEHRVALAEQEELLRQQTPPPLGDSILTRELESLRETRARLETLTK